MQDCPSLPHLHTLPALLRPPSLCLQCPAEIPLLCGHARQKQPLLWAPAAHVAPTTHLSPSYAIVHFCVLDFQVGGTVPEGSSSCISRLQRFAYLPTQCALDTSRSFCSFKSGPLSTRVALHFMDLVSREAI